MLKRSLPIVSLGLVTFLGCAMDAPTPDAAEVVTPPVGLATQADTPAAGPGLDTASGFPYRLVDRFVSFEDFSTMVRDSVISLPGVLGSVEAKNDANDFLARVQATTPPHRLLGGRQQIEKGSSGGVRVVQVYTDAPVYIIGGFALLPDAAGNAVDPNAFKLDGSDDTALDTFCMQQSARCIPLSREHVSNRYVAAILLAARTIIVRGVNHTDGMSLVTVAETLLMPRKADSLDLSPRGAQYVYGAEDDAPASPATPEYPGQAAGPHSGGTKIVLYRAMPGSPRVVETLESSSFEDAIWQQQRGADMDGVSLNKATQGLAGLAGGNLLALTMRASHLQLSTGGQTGGYGASGISGQYACAYGPQPFYPPHWLDCTDLASSYCPDVCGAFTAPTDGGAGGAGGDPGSIHVLSASDTSPWCAFSEASLRNVKAHEPMEPGDAPEGYDLRCADGVADDRDGDNVDCASSFCNSDLNVLVCGTKEALFIDVGGIKIAPGASFGVGKGAVNITPAIATAIPIRRPFPIPKLDGDLLCKDSREYDRIEVRTADGGYGGLGAGVYGKSCAYPGVGYPVYCTSTMRTASGPKGPSGAGTPVLDYNHFRAKWTRLAWSIAMNRLQPLEIQRRLAIAHERFRAGDLVSAKARYLSTSFVLAANQRRVAGAHTDGTVFDCSKTVWHPTPTSPTPTAGETAPDGLGEICAMRVELDSYLARLNAGQNFFGYAPDYQVPNVVPTDKLISWAVSELAGAKASLSDWGIGAAVSDLAASTTLRSDDFLEEQRNALHALYQPGGSLSDALVNARKEKQASIDELKTLNAMAIADSESTFILSNDDGTEATFATDKLEMKVIGFGITTAMTAAGAGPIASTVSDAITGAIGEDSIGWDGSSEYRLNTLAQEITGGLPSGAGAALDAESTPEGSRDLQRLKLEGELFQIILRERDEVRNLARAAGEEQRVLAQIAEAQAQEQRFLANEAAYALHDSAQLDVLLDAQYQSALRSVRRAGELTFLAIRAADRDAMAYSVASDGTKTNLLTPKIDADLAKNLTAYAATSANVDVRLDPASIDAWSQTLSDLQIAAFYGFPSVYKTREGLTKVVPITPSMKYVDPKTGGVVYGVGVDVSLDDVHATPSLTNTAAHKLTDMTVLLDTGISGSDVSVVPVSFARDDKDAYWLGKTIAGGGIGADRSEFLFLGGAEGGPLAASSATPLALLYTTPGWTAEPTLQFPPCRGSAATNAAAVSAIGGPPSACRMTSYPPPAGGAMVATAAAAYQGRSLLGRYDFVVPAEALVGSTNALRVYFQYTARDAF